MDLGQVAYSTLFGLTVAHYIVSATLFVRWRTLFPIRGREVWLCLSMGAAFVCWVSTDIFVGIVGEFPCAIHLVFSYLMLVYVQILYLMRAWRVWFLFYAACEQLANRRRQREESRASTMSDDTVRSTAPLKSKATSIDMSAPPKSLAPTKIDSPPVSVSVPTTPLASTVNNTPALTPVASSNLEMASLALPGPPPMRRGNSSFGHSPSRGGSMRSTMLTFEDYLDMIEDNGGGDDDDDANIVRDGRVNSTASSDASSSLSSGGAEGTSGKKIVGFRIPPPAKAKSNTAKAKSWKERNPRWFERHRHWARESNMANVALAIFALEAIGPVAAFMNAALRSDFVVVARVCPSLDFSLYFLTGYVGITVLVAIYTAYRLRMVHDAFGIKKELAWASLAGVVACASANVFDIEDPMQAHLQRALFIATANVFLASLFTVPVVAAYKNFRANGGRKVSPTDTRASIATVDFESIAVEEARTSDAAVDGSRVSKTLAEVICNPDELNAFMEHLKREFATENIIFYLECRRFAKRCKLSEDEGGSGSGAPPRKGAWRSTEERNFHAAKIYADFLTRSSPMEVNLSWSLTKPIIESVRTSIHDFNVYAFRNMEAQHKYAGIKVVKPVPSHIFRKAASRIFKLMEQDSFVRFVNARRATAHESHRSSSDVEATGGGRRLSGDDGEAGTGVPQHHRHVSTWDAEMPRNVV